MVFSGWCVSGYYVDYNFLFFLSSLGSGIKLVLIIVMQLFRKLTRDVRGYVQKVDQYSNFKAVYILVCLIHPVYLTYFFWCMYSVLIMGKT